MNIYHLLLISFFLLLINSKSSDESRIHIKREKILYDEPNSNEEYGNEISNKGGENEISNENNGNENYSVEYSNEESDKENGNEKSNTENKNEGSTGENEDETPNGESEHKKSNDEKNGNVKTNGKNRIKDQSAEGLNIVSNEENGNEKSNTENTNEVSTKVNKNVKPNGKNGYKKSNEKNGNTKSDGKNENEDNAAEDYNEESNKDNKSEEADKENENEKPDGKQGHKKSNLKNRHNKLIAKNENEESNGENKSENSDSTSSEEIKKEEYHKKPNVSWAEYDTIDTVHKARPHEYPYHVAFVWKPDGRLLCQGVLVSSQWVIGSAVCLQKYENVIKHVGMIIGAESLHDSSAVSRDIHWKWYHPSFDYDNGLNDVVIVQLDVEVGEKDAAVPVLTEELYHPDSRKCQLTHYVDGTLYGMSVDYVFQENCEPSFIEGQQFSFFCVKYQGAFITADNMSIFGSPVVCGDAVYGLKTFETLFTSASSLIEWIDTIETSKTSSEEDEGSDQVSWE